MLLFVVVAVLVTAVFGAYRKERESHSLRAESEAQLTDLTSRKLQLEADITKLKTDRGMESALREQYQLARSGEGLIVIVDPSAPAPLVEKKSPVMDWFNKTFIWW